MRLILQNRGMQNVLMHFTHVDGLSDRCDILPNAERAIPMDYRTRPDGSRLSTPAEDLSHVLDDLARFGVVSADGADRYNAARDPHAPPWKGVVYRVDGDS